MQVDFIIAEWRRLNYIKNKKKVNQGHARAMMHSEVGEAFKMK